MGTTKRIYLDYNATTPLDPEVRDFFVKELDLYANGSSMHEDGRVVARRIRDARAEVAALIGAKPDEIYFTSGGSESNNTVFNTVCSPALARTSFLRERFGSRRGVVTSSIEHLA
jgi:cysteine desulfurase